jgi:tRNA-2-methylthio-N6-dimethylallyladenosine synthase
MLTKLFIETWGCQMNEYDSQKMADLLVKSHKLQQINDPMQADVLLLNTCSIREKAQEKVFSLLGRWKDLKESRPHVIIGVGGCVASQEGDQIFKRAPFVDFVFGPQTLQHLPLYVNQVLAGVKHQVNIDFLPDEKFDNLPDPRAEGPTCFVTIQEGCSKYCKYCIVPFTRGQEVNRSFNDIIAEIHELAQQGVREVTLLGQNVNAYQGQTPTGEPADLASLIFYVSHIPGIDRIRFTTSHPVEFSDTLVDAYAHVPQLVSHLHLPVQSGSDRTLQAMGRGHTIASYIEKIQDLKKIRPDLTLTSDFIVAYPGETEEDFQETLKLVDLLEFDQSFSFIYSPRPGTLAAGLPCDLTLEEKKNRLNRLQEKLAHFALKTQNNMLNKSFSVLITGPSKMGNTFVGRTENNRVVHVVGAHQKLVGCFVDVLITEVMPNSLKGRFLRLNDPYLEQRSFLNDLNGVVDEQRSEEYKYGVEC